MPHMIHPRPEAIARAAANIQNGQLVVFPTETVYGVGADARNATAVAKIYALKNRPEYNPLIVHVASTADAEALAVFDNRVHTLATALWPGPLTLVLPKRSDSGLADNATAGLDTVAVRVPAHPVIQDLLRAANCPIAAPSANPSGTLSPTRPEHIARHLAQQKLYDADILVLAGGATRIGVESTVLDLTTAKPRILRAGAIGPDELEPLIGAVVYADENDAIKGPGQLKRHYATVTPLRLNAVDVRAGEAFLGFGKTNFIGVAGIGFVKDLPHTQWRNLSPDGDLHQAAVNLYAYLDELDQIGATAIAVQAIPPSGLGVAMNDRLRRAAVPKDSVSK